MCRSIKQLRSAEQPPTDDEIAAAALQFVRKVSGYRVPSRVNQSVFDHAIAEIAASTRVLLTKLKPANQTRSVTGSPRKDRVKAPRIHAYSR
jgi:hypothetical protein